MTQDFLLEYNNFLKEFIKNNDKCKDCIFNHKWLGGCFFASDCLPNDQKHWREE